MTSILKPEKALVSAAGTLRMLREVDNILRDKPFIPVHMASVLPDTAVQLTAGQAALVQAGVVVHREVQSFLDEWAADLGLKNGSTFGATFMPYRGEAPDSLRIEGCVHHCEVSPRLVDNTRMVYVFLTYPSFKLKSGQSAATVLGLTEAFRKRVDSGYLQSPIFQELPAKDSAGEDEPTFRIAVPIQAKARKELERGVWYGSLKLD